MQMNIEKLQKMAGAHALVEMEALEEPFTLKTVFLHVFIVNHLHLYSSELSIFILSVVQALTAANTWVVSGSPQTKRPNNLDNLRKLAEQFQRQMPGGVGGVPETIPKEDDDDVPDLVAGETFDAAAKEEKTHVYRYCKGHTSLQFLLLYFVVANEFMLIPLFCV
ncbi:hypothetical protein MKW94_019483 [Papaver nudicaule]|uniref:Uncharacterized protein n=1 Tax=Papaver nudicaule TaxID=74823 RepID=A0AA41SBE5_PAPNU|nr:hypothetical protein [Papaver nudicaule]